MSRRRGLPLLAVSVPCILAVAVLGACAGPADPVTSAASGTSSTTAVAASPSEKTPPVDHSPVALRKAWSVAVAPIAQARNVSYDTVLTMTLPGKDGWRAKVVVSERIDVEHHLTEQTAYGDLVAEGRAPTRFREVIVGVGKRNTFVAIGGSPWRRTADRVAATQLAPIDLPEPHPLPAGMRAVSLVSLTTEYGHPCIKGELTPELGLTALGFGRWLRLDPDLTRRLTGRVPVTIRLHDDGSIDEIEVTGEGHTLRTTSAADDAALLEAVAGSSSVVDLGTYDVDMTIRVPKAGAASL